MRVAFSHLLFGVFNVVLADPASMIPTKEEQINLLTNVEEIFNHVKVMVKDEGGATDSAVIGDVQRMVDRASEHLSVVEELALLKLTCLASENVSPRKHLKQKVQKIIEEGELRLQGCVDEASRSISNNSNVVTSTTGAAMNQGQVLLDTLHKCSKKAGLQQISCYRKVMASDVFPLKVTLLDAIQMHKTGHMGAITVREMAYECVDDVVRSYEARVGQILSEALQP